MIIKYILLAVGIAIVVVIACVVLVCCIVAGQADSRLDKYCDGDCYRCEWKERCRAYKKFMEGKRG